MDFWMYEKMGNYCGKVRKDQFGIFNFVLCWEELSMVLSIVQYVLLYKNVDLDKVLVSFGSIICIVVLKFVVILLLELM